MCKDAVPSPFDPEHCYQLNRDKVLDLFIYSHIVRMTFNELSTKNSSTAWLYAMMSMGGLRRPQQFSNDFDNLESNEFIGDIKYCLL